MELIHHICERDISKQKQNNRLNMGVKTKTSGLLESSARAVAGAKLVAGSCRRRGARETGGANRDRTDDLLLAKQALSQLSYGPTI